MSMIVKGAKLAGIAWLASILPSQPAHALIVLSTPEQPDGLVGCGAEGCPAAWARAMAWLEQECLSTEISPEFSNSIFKYRNATGILKNDQTLKVIISMRMSLSGFQESQIEIEQFDHGKYGAGLGSEQHARNARIFTDFKNYIQDGAKAAQ
jgi:hypothetical protein